MHAIRVRRSTSVEHTPGILWGLYVTLANYTLVAVGIAREGRSNSSDSRKYIAQQDEEGVEMYLWVRHWGVTFLVHAEVQCENRVRGTATELFNCASTSTEQ